jgi:hypothetical protein
MVSRHPSNHSQMICSDCSHPMTAYLQSLKPRCSWGDFGAVALVLAIGCSAMGLTTMRTLLSSGQHDLVPAPEQHSRQH